MNLSLAETTVIPGLKGRCCKRCFGDASSSCSVPFPVTKVLILGRGAIFLLPGADSAARGSGRTTARERI